MKFIRILLSLLYLLLCFASCCDKKELGRINFQQSDLSVNPYIGNETLSFADNNGNIIIFNGNWRKTNTTRTDGCADCCQDYYTIQSSDNTTFSSVFLNSQLSVDLLINYNEFNHKTNPSLTFSWSDHPNQSSIENISFSNFPIINIQDTAERWNLYHDVLILRDKTFHQVYTAVVSNYSNDRLHPDSLYSTIAEGIVGIKLSDNNTLVKQ
jgi:hypothetical protein